MKNCSLIFLLSFVLAACDYRIVWIDGEYGAHWIHTPQNLSLARKVSPTVPIGRFKANIRVNARILAIGSNDKYIVAKQRNLGSDFDSISYFVIDKSKDNMHLNQDEITQGPLSELRFLEMKKELGLPEFTEKF